MPRLKRLFNAPPLGPLRLFLIFLVLQLSAPAPVFPQQQKSPPHSAKKVLVLYTYGESLPGYRKAGAAFWPVITAGGVSPNDIFTEYLDLQRNQGAEYRQRVADLLHYKYARQQIGLIFVVHTGALEFLLEEGKGLFPDVPVLSYLIVRPELIEKKNTGRPILLRLQNLDMVGTLEIALKIFPQTRKVVFVTGTAEADRRFEHEARLIFEPWRNKLEFQYTSDRSVEEVLQLVASLPPRSIVIYSNVFSDTTGRTFIPLEVGKRVAKAANAPVFCLWDTLLGSGPIGGSLLSFEAEGAYAAKMALDILNGKILPAKAVTTLPTEKTFMFDWRQLRRWGVSESTLPEGSIVLNRELTFWDFKYYILAILAVGVIQWFLIGGLLAQRRRRATADESLRERLRFERLVADLSAKFLNVTPEEVDREIERALKEIVGFFRVTHSVLIKGYPEEHRAGITHAAHADDVPPTPIRGDLYAAMPWTSKMCEQGEMIRVTMLDEMPAEAAADKEVYSNLGIRSFLVIPISVKGSAVYAIAISSRREERVWPEDYVPRMALLGEILVNTLERQQAQEALLASELNYRGLHDSMRDAFVKVDMSGRIQEFNSSYQIMLGYSAEELRQTTYQDLTPEKWQDSEEAIIQKEVLSRGYSEVYEKEYRKKDGTAFPVELRTFLLKDSTDGNVGMWAIVRDITERKRAEEEIRENQKRLEELIEELKRVQEHLEERVKERTLELLMAMNRAEAANRAKSAFLANMSHELRTPLTSILGISQLMERDTEFPPRHREVLGILSRSGKHLFELIDDILEISRIEADQSSMVRTNFDLHRFLEDLMMMVPRPERKNLDVVLERDPGVPRFIRTDERRLRQILLNLLGNAVKFTEEGRVTLRAKMTGVSQREGGAEGRSVARLEFEIEDTGIGIAEEDREKIFEPFVQLSARNTSGGTGLGLPLSRKLAGLLGGDITVSSRVGRGSTFRLEVCVETAEESDVPVREVPRQVAGLASGQSYGLLVVDDNLENRILLRQLLEPVGFRIWEAPGGREAIDLHEKVQPDLIWMDIRMPGMDGYETARRIRKAENGRRNPDGREVHTPILALTAGVMEQKQSSPLAGVFDDWVYKPFRETELFEKLEKHLGVQFVYQSPRSPEEKGPGEPVLQPGDLAGLPRDWRERFLQAVKRGRTRQMHDLIEEIRPDFAETARALTDLIRLYKFEHIARGLEALQE